jgi:hypothetical protein
LNSSLRVDFIQLNRPLQSLLHVSNLLHRIKSITVRAEYLLKIVFKINKCLLIIKDFLTKHHC